MNCPRLALPVVQNGRVCAMPAGAYVTGAVWRLLSYRKGVELEI